MMLLEVKNLKKYFNIDRRATLKAVDDVSFAIDEGETMGLVGESGCGKSTLGRTIVGLYPSTGGEILVDGKPVNLRNRTDRLAFSKSVQMIFQDPYSSLNPRMTVGQIVAEGIDIHGLSSGSERDEIVYGLLEMVGLSREHANRFPHEFSGGQRQRVGIARALATKPRLIVCDEPISALDVSIQAQVINLLEDLQRELGLAYLFIAHDIGMVAHISRRIAVMYLGTFCELASSSDIMENPMHPYTKALLSAAPFADPWRSRERARIKLTGDVPDPISITEGCRFAGRCHLAKAYCIQNSPVLREVEDGHYVSCHAVADTPGYKEEKQ